MASGDTYEHYVGRGSRLVARDFLSWVAAPPDGDWRDVGCGTGTPCEAILKITSPRCVTGIDPSEGFLSYARYRVVDPRLGFQVGDARALSAPDASFNATVSGLKINFVPDHAKAVGEMR